MTESESESARFATLRLSGGRYEHKGYPLAGLPELARYERLVIDVARALWRARHPDRRRAPRNFAERLGLRLTDVRPGSVMPLLERVEPAVSGQVALAEVDGVFEDARGEIEQAIEALVSGLAVPPSFPAEALGSFVQFGKSLRRDEAIQFRPGTEHAVTYTQKVRRRLLSTGQVDEFALDGALIGRLTALDATNRTFTLTTLLDEQLEGRYADRELTPVFLELLNEREFAVVARLEGRYTVDDASRIKSIDDVWDLEAFAVPEIPEAERLVQLAALAPGWLDGGGVGIVFAALDFARDLLGEINARKLAGPRIFPMEDGGVQLQWILDGRTRVVSVEITSDLDLYVADVGSGTPVDDQVPTMMMVLSFLEERLSGD